MAAPDERNFRASFYGKVGFKGIEEKKSIEIILKDQPLDLGKLSQFGLRFPVPTSYRYFIWQVLLGVLPPHQAVHAFVLEQRKCQYKDLEKALRVMSRVDDDTTLNMLFLKMYLIEEEVLPLDEQNMCEDGYNVTFLAVASIIIELLTDPVDAFWLCVFFTKHLQKFKPSLELLPLHTINTLKQQDAELFAHLCTYNLVEVLPLKTWFQTCFATIFSEEVLEKIWDRVIGGSCKILVFVAVSVLLAMKKKIMTLKKTRELTLLMNVVHLDNSDLILSNALDLWSRDGCQLLPSHNQTDLPVVVGDKTAS